jgi:antitoxin ParD1/3/4
MTVIPVNLPDNLKAYVEEKARNGGYASAGEYIVALVAAASEKRNEIELALMAGLASGPAAPWTGEEWQTVKDRIASQGNQ